jgi:lycopene beta-cyclase
MTSHRFPFYKDGVYYIGAAGGQTKASTGYTFQFIQKQSERIAGALNKGITDLTGIQPDRSRFRLYDNILLRVLSEKKMTGEEIFSTLFKKIPAEKVFRFLDNETTLAEEFHILNAMPSGTFGIAAIKQIFS